MSPKIKLHIKPNPPTQHSGFSLIETMVTMSIFFIILFGVYMMIVHYGDVTKTEHARMNVQQVNRFIGSVMTDELKDAGAVLTLAHTGGFLGKAPIFNGIFPLNSTNFPDGIIVATGDPEAVTKLSAAVAPGASTLNVDSTLVPASLKDAEEYPPWDVGNIGMILCDTGYYIFSVTNVAGNSISIRAWETPVYASGQLDCPAYGYKDKISNSVGSTETYPVGSMVVRLSNFAIYLFDQTYDKQMHRQIRRLNRVTDTHGVVDVLADLKDELNAVVESSVITENIWDMQISYVGYADFPTADRLTGQTITLNKNESGNTNAVFAVLMQDINSRRIKQIDVNILTITNAFGGIGKANTVLPIMGDRAIAETLPAGKFGIKVSNFSIELRNFSTIL